MNTNRIASFTNEQRKIDYPKIASGRGVEIDPRRQRAHPFLARNVRLITNSRINNEARMKTSGDLTMLLF